MLVSSLFHLFTSHVIFARNLCSCTAPVTLHFIWRGPQDMNRLLVLLLISFLSIVVVSVHAKEPLPNFSQLCIADHGTGFNWRDGAWKQVNFIEPKYVVSKIDYPNTPPEDTSDSDFIIYYSCTIPLRVKEKTDYGFLKSYNICVRMQEVGVEHTDYFACTESHFEDRDTKKWGLYTIVPIFLAIRPAPSYIPCRTRR